MNDLYQISLLVPKQILRCTQNDNLCVADSLRVIPSVIEESMFWILLFLHRSLHSLCSVEMTEFVRSKIGSFHSRKACHSGLDLGRQIKSYTSLKTLANFLRLAKEKAEPSSCLWFGSEISHTKLNL